MATVPCHHPPKEHVMFTQHLRRTRTDDAAAAPVVCVGRCDHLVAGSVHRALAAAATRPRRSARLQIKNNSVQGIDIKDGTIKSADIAARHAQRALKGQRRSRPAEHGATASRATRATRATPGRLRGAPGAPGVSGLQQRHRQHAVATPSSGKSLIGELPGRQEGPRNRLRHRRRRRPAPDPNLYKEATIDEVDHRPRPRARRRSTPTSRRAAPRRTGRSAARSSARPSR